MPLFPLNDNQLKPALFNILYVLLEHNYLTANLAHIHNIVVYPTFNVTIH